MKRPRNHIRTRTAFDDSTGVHQYNLACQRRYQGHVMADEQDRHAMLSMKLREQACDFGPQTSVELAGRFVGYQ